MKYLHSNTGTLLKKIALLLLLYTISRILFFAFNHAHFSDLGFKSFLSILFYGIYFDASTIAILNLGFIILYMLPVPFREKKWYRIVLLWLFVLVNSIALLANCADLVYFQFTLKRTTADVFSFFGAGRGNDLGRLLPLFLKDYWYVFLIWAVLSWVLVRGFRRTEKRDPLTWDKKTWINQSLQFLIILVLSILTYRGGFQLRPIGIVNAGEYTESKYIPVVLNTPFSILKTMEVEGMKEHVYFTNKEQVKKYFDPHHKAGKGPMKKLNVFVIALESFSKEYVGALNPHRKGYTPFLDSLISQSLVFANAFSNGKKSIEGIPAIVAGIPSWTDEPYITSRYGNNEIKSLANILKAEGYSTSFFHGGTNGTMGFDAFAGLAGFDNYYGRTEYNNEKDYDGNWGIWDEEFLQYTAKMLNKQRQPFFSTLFTLTSHHPYPIPARYKDKFKEGILEIHKTISYSDYALRRFFETAKTMPWFANTLFVLSADHTGITNDPFYANRVGNFAIPILYYLPGSNLRGIDSTVTQQIDIMPSVLDYLHYDKPYFAFGNSVFDSLAPHYAVAFNYECYELFEKYYVTQFSDYQEMDLYYYKNDSTLKKEVREQHWDVYDYMNKKSKAIKQVYEEAVTQNKMK